MLTETKRMETRIQAQPSPRPAVAAPPRPMLLVWLFPGLITGGLLWGSFFPLGWSWLIWFALVPLLSLVRLDISRRRIWWGAYLAGAAFFWPTLQWMRVADYRMYATWAMLATYCSVYFLLAIVLIRYLDRRTRLPLVASVALVWTGLEFLRSFALTGFAWYFLGHSQHAILSLIQIADVTGVYGISFLIAAVNAWLFELAYHNEALRRALGNVQRQPESGPALVLQGVLIATLLLATVTYGFWRLEHDDFRPGPRVALLQGNIDQRIRNEASAGKEPTMKSLVDYYEALCKRATYVSPRPDLLVWPETSLPYAWYELPEDLSKVNDEIRKHSELLNGLLGELARDNKAAQLFGLNSVTLDESGNRTLFNTALHFDLHGRRSGRYDKMHRLPFGEYVPFRDWLPFMDAFAPYDFDYSIRAGDKFTRFELTSPSMPLKEGKGYHFGVLICYEDTDPELARAYATTGKDGPPVDFLVNISNDGWFDGTNEHEEHLALCRFRAIETRRPIARAVNMGISAVIDSNGRVQKPALYPIFKEDCRFWVIEDHHGHIPDLPESEWHEYKKQLGILTATIPLDNRTSLYASYGDWFSYACWAAILAFGVCAWRRPQPA